MVVLSGIINPLTHPRSFIRHKVLCNTHYYCLLLRHFYGGKEDQGKLSKTFVEPNQCGKCSFVHIGLVLQNVYCGGLLGP